MKKLVIFTIKKWQSIKSKWFEL